MSFIAKSLKKLKDQDKFNHGFSVSEKRRFDIFSSEIAIYIITGLVVLVVVILEIFNVYEGIKRCRTKIDELRPISSIEKDLKNNKKYMKARVMSDEFEYYLSTGDLKKLYELSKKRNNLKYEGIYYAEMGNQDKAVKLLSEYLDRQPHDAEAKAYLALVYYKSGNYSQALKELCNIKNKNGIVYMDMGVVSERMGNVREAFRNYSKAFEMIQDENLRFKIKMKIVLLRVYLSKGGYGEF